MWPPAIFSAILSRRNFISVAMQGMHLAFILLFFAKVVVSDNLALLLGTLRTYQRTGCDRDMVMLKCPHGTTISVQLANYGRGSSDNPRCPSATSSTADPAKNSTCLLPQAVQYSFLQIVVEACQKKRQCKFHATPKTALSDPCPGVPKNVEVTYKCRPYEFRSKVACENEVVQLNCNPNSRIAVYSASFGRTEYESVQCPQPQGVPEETCLLSYATEIVMHICHGKRRCTIGADVSTFGKPCRPTSRMYLKIVYTCVPRKVVLEAIEEPTLDDESSVGPSRDTTDYDDLEGYDMGDIFRESAFSPKAGMGKGLAVNITQTTPTMPLAKDQTSENQEKMYLYLIVSITSGLLVFLVIVIARLMMHRYKTGREVKMYSSHHDHTIPHEFGDENSEIDADITLATTPVAVPHISTLGGSTYRSTSAPCRQQQTHPSSIDIVPYRESEDPAQLDAPRSLSRYGNSQYYFG